MTRLAVSALAPLLDDLLSRAKARRLYPATAQGRRLREELITPEPDLLSLARFLRHCKTSFAGLEEELAFRQGARFRRPWPYVDPRLVVERLDLGLRSLRRERSVRIPELHKAVPTITEDTLRTFETPSLEPRRPTLSELDDLLHALGASYRDLEERATDPARPQTTGRKARHAQPRPRLAARGRLLSPLASERLDIALRSLRAERGISSPQLAAQAGLDPGRLQAIETPDRRAVPTQDELTRLLAALGVLDIDLAALERAARYPLHALDSVRRRWQQRQEARWDVRIDGERIPRAVLERTDLALRSLRRLRSLSQTSLADASGLPRHRLTQLENPSSDAPPNAQELYALLAALDATLEDFTTAALKPLSLVRARRQSARPSHSAADPPTTRGAALLPAADAAKRSIARFAACCTGPPSSEKA